MDSDEFEAWRHALRDRVVDTTWSDQPLSTVLMADDLGISTIHASLCHDLAAAVAESLAKADTRRLRYDIVYSGRARAFVAVRTYNIEIDIERIFA